MGRREEERKQIDKNIELLDGERKRTRGKERTEESEREKERERGRERGGERERRIRNMSG